MKMWGYDIELYQNFVSFGFEDMMSNERRLFYIYKNDFGNIIHNDLFAFTNFMADCKRNKDIFIGYNNINYDSKIIAFVLHYPYNKETFFENLYDLSQTLVHMEYGDKLPSKFKDIYTYLKEFNQIDLMKILRHDSLRKSLKQTLINIQFHNIQSLPIEFDSFIEESDIPILIEYNFNDIEGTKALANTHEVKNEIKQRYFASKKYNNAYLINLSRAGLADKLLLIDYCKLTNTTWQDLQNLKTDVRNISIGLLINRDIKFETKILQDLLAKLKHTTINSTTEISYRVEINSTKYDIKSGGLHSVDNPNIFKKGLYNYIDADVSSFYPRIIINNKVFPGHLTEYFLDIIRRDTTERVKLKHSNNPDDKEEATILKIKLNSIFGGFNCEYKFWYDRKCLVKTTINGQLVLLMLIEQLEQNNIHIISANTDGIVAEVPDDKIKLYHQICNTWSLRHKYELEFIEYNLYVRADVNNYIARTIDGKIKRKGAFDQFKYKDLSSGSYPGYSYPIVARCVEEYFVNKKDIMTTLLKSNDILDFALSEKAAKKYQFVFKEIKEGIFVETYLQKDLRFYVCDKGGILVKRDKLTNKEIAICKGLYVKDCNRVIKGTPINEYNINYIWYKNEAMKLIAAVETKTKVKKEIKKRINAFELNFDETTNNTD